MKRQHDNITIASATLSNVSTLCKWWASGEVMKHAGFPKGLIVDKSKLQERIIYQNSDPLNQLLVISYNEVPIGEMGFKNTSPNEFQIGIKICDFSMHNKGIGTTTIKMLINYLKDELGATRIHLDTNLNNKNAQKFYEKLGFKKYKTLYNNWKDQTNTLQSTIYYDVYV